MMHRAPLLMRLWGRLPRWLKFFLAADVMSVGAVAVLDEERNGKAVEQNADAECCPPFVSMACKTVGPPASRELQGCATPVTPQQVGKTRRNGNDIARPLVCDDVVGLGSLHGQRV